MKIHNRPSTKAAGSIILTFIMLLSFAHKAEAQQKIDPTVEVEKEFDGKMTNIVKGPLNTYIPDSLLSFNLNFNYSIFDKPYKDLYEFTPLQSARLQGAAEEKYPVFMAKAGIGFPLAPIAEIYFQPQLGKSSRLSLKAFFDGYYGKNNIVGTNYESNMAQKLADARVAAPDHTLGAGANYGYNWQNGFFTLGVDYTNNYCTYYGFSEEKWLEAAALGAATDDRGYMKSNYSHTYNQFTTSASVGSIDSYYRRAKFNYLANISFQNTSDKFYGININENLFAVNGFISPALNRFSRLSIEFNSENMLQNMKPLHNAGYGIFDIVPTLTWNKGRWSLKAGVKLSGKYKNGKEMDDADKYHSYIFAVADFSYNIVKDNLWIYANIDGGNRLNSYSSILKENKWINPLTEFKASSMPLIVNGGIKGKVINKLGYNAYVKYAVHKGLLQYAYLPWNSNDAQHNTLSAVYGNCNEFTVGAAINWKSKEFEGGAAAEYSNYTDCKKSTLEFKHKPFGYAPLKLTLHGTYNYIERFYAGVAVEYRSKCDSYWGSNLVFNPNLQGEGQTYYMKSYVNLSVDLRYAINRNFSLFANGQNLLNSQIQHLPNYLEKGINLAVGLLVKF